MRGPCLALDEEASTVVVTADDKLFAALGDTPYANLGHPLSGTANFTPSTNCRPPMYYNPYCNRAGTQWTK